MQTDTLGGCPFFRVNPAASIDKSRQKSDNITVNLSRRERRII